MPRFTNLIAYLLGAFSAIAWLARAVDRLWPCEYESPVRHRPRGDCG